jgi:thiamine-phosphate diphosphorylase
LARGARSIRGLYGIADAEASGGEPERAGAAMLAGGCRLVQLRCKGWSEDDIVSVGRSLLARCRATGATLLVNDLPEVAVAIDADGVHVGPEDGSIASARRIVGSRIVGWSTNSAEAVHAALAEAPDYVAFGPVFPTPRLSRPKSVQGVAAVAAIRGRVPIPLVAIGGITPENLAQVRATGVDAWAVIGAICASPDPVAATRALLG